jgi:ribonuclease Z
LFEITILGSSGAIPAYGRYPSCQFIQVANKYFLIDCGEGAQMQMSRFQVPFHKIQRIFISHLHGDHVLGLMGLLFSMHLQKRSADLHLHAFKGLDEIIIAHLKYSHSALNFTIVFHTTQEGTMETIFEDDTITVETIPLYHRIACSGFLIKEKPKPRRINKNKLPPTILLQQIIALKEGRDILDDAGNIIYKNDALTLPPPPSLSYAYCSDTAFNLEIAKQIEGVNLLYHEATFMQEEKKKALETFHSTTADAAHIAIQSNAKALLIGHFSARYRDLDLVLKETQEIFPNTSLAIEGQTFKIEA